MRFVKTTPGEELESIVDFRTIEFEDLIVERRGYDLFKTITLLMYDGLSSRAKSTPYGREYLISMHPAIQWLSEFSKPVEFYQEKNGLTNFGGIEIIPSDVALYLFEDELELNLDLCKSRYDYFDIEEAICQDVCENKRYQDELMKEIYSIIEDIKKYEQVTDIVLDREFRLFSREESRLANDDDKFTISELSNYWGMTDANIRMAIRNRKFDMSVIEKRMGTYLIPKYEMDRIFGDYGEYNLKKIKRKLGFKKELVSEYKALIDECLMELDEILIDAIDDVHGKVTGTRPIDSYDSLKYLMIEMLKSEDIETKKSFLIEMIKYYRRNGRALNKLLERNDKLLYFSVFEKFILRNNRSEEYYKNKCEDVYLSINNDIEGRFLQYYKLDSRRGYYDIGNPRRYTKELKLDVYGLSRRDINEYGVGFKIGEMHGTFHNIVKIVEDGLEGRLGELISLEDNMREDLFHMLFMNDDICHYEDFNPFGNLLYVHKLLLKEDYNKPEVIRLIMRNLKYDIDHLYDHDVDTICYINHKTDERWSDYGKTLKYIGFSEVKNEDYTLLFLNTINDVLHKPIKKNDFDFSWPGYVESDDNEEKIVDEVIVDGHSFYQLRPYYKGDIIRWVCKVNGETIKIQNRYNKDWIYEKYNVVGKRMILWAYDIGEYSFIDVCRMALKSIPKTDVGMIKKRDGSKYKIKVKCIQDYSELQGGIIFHEGRIYRAKDDGYELGISVGMGIMQVAKDYEGKWERDPFFKKHFELVEQ